MTTPNELYDLILSALNAATKIPFGYFDSQAGQEKLARYLAEKLAPREGLEGACYCCREGCNLDGCRCDIPIYSRKKVRP